MKFKKIKDLVKGDVVQFSEEDIITIHKIEELGDEILVFYDIGETSGDNWDIGQICNPKIEVPVKD